MTGILLLLYASDLLRLIDGRWYVVPDTAASELALGNSSAPLAKPAPLGFVVLTAGGMMFMDMAHDLLMVPTMPF
jgi:hypothetical protein